MGFIHEAPTQGKQTELQLTERGQPGEAAAPPPSAPPEPARVAVREKMLGALLLLRRDAKLPLLAPSLMLFGFAAAFMNGWVNHAVGVQLGGHAIGYFVALTAVVAMVGAMTCSALASRRRLTT